LREQARDVLSRALAGENVDMQQLDAARSLFSYRADQPPLSDPTGGE
jgi:plasmid stability protein